MIRRLIVGVYSHSQLMNRHLMGGFARKADTSTVKNKKIISFEDRLNKFSNKQTEELRSQDLKVEISKDPKETATQNDPQYDKTRVRKFKTSAAHMTVDASKPMRVFRTEVSDISMFNNETDLRGTIERISGYKAKADGPKKPGEDRGMAKVDRKEGTVEQFIDKEKLAVSVESKLERVTKYLNRSSVCSRRQAEKLIEEGMVRVNGKKILANCLIDATKDSVSIFTKKGEYFPMKESTKVWLFYKPMGLICTHKDPNKRPTIFEYIKSSGKIKEEFIISVGRLDYNSEGLILLTNDGDLARALELPSNKIERTYRVRVFGNLDEDKLVKIRKGAVINGVQYGPFWCEVDKYQTRNTWLNIKMNQGKNREIRRIMQKHSLRVNRLKRTHYGPFSLGNLAAGDIVEAPITSEIRRLSYLSKRAKLKEVEQEKMTHEGLKEHVLEKLEGKLLDPRSVLGGQSRPQKQMEA